MKPSRVLPLVLALFGVLSARAATPPALVNYQGVLRNAQDQPQNGTFDMTFRFFDAQSAGNEILIDAHTTGGGNPVTVSNGLFAVQLGGGTVSDGAGAGTYTSLAQVFRDFSAVWLETRVGSETLSPRTRVVSSAYALNADSLGGQPAGNYVDTSSSSQTKAGALTCNNGVEGDSNFGFGVFGNGGAAGGVFQATTGTAYAYLGFHNPEQYGIKAAGSDAGGFFRGGGSGTAYVAQGDVGIVASGNTGGGNFSSTGASGQAYVAWGDVGLYGYGNAAGGSFHNAATGSNANIASGNYGLDADGTYCAPYCGAGGHFTNFPYSGAMFAALGDTGIYATGGYQGGEFLCDGKAGHAQLALGNFGVVGYGADPGGLAGGGGYFTDVTSGSKAYVAANTQGVYANGSDVGGHFENSRGQSSVDLATGNIAVYAVGSGMGGYFEHSLSFAWADVATGSGGSYYTILGNGAKSFVQNDPFDKDKVVVFAALEGDEAGTYTRGTARLSHGSARVGLSPSFALVTNPDIGLTAHVTPRGAAVPLSVSSVSTGELLVGGPSDQDVTFDYVVFGLRLGFEEHPPIQPRRQDAPIPRTARPKDVAGIDPSLTPLGRFAAMRTALGDAGPLDLSRSEALKSAVGFGDAPRESPAAVHPEGPSSPPGSTAQVATPSGGAATAGAARSYASAPAAAPPIQVVMAPAFPPGTAPAAILEPAVAGEILALDPVVSADRLVRARGSATETVVGIVAGEPGARWDDTAPLALSGSIVLCEVDAAYGAVHPGDLLVASATPGAARRGENPPPGAVLGRALDGLEAGTSAIRVLVRPQ
jgi:hypothetical protein